MPTRKLLNRNLTLEQCTEVITKWNSFTSTRPFYNAQLPGLMFIRVFWSLSLSLKVDFLFQRSFLVLTISGVYTSRTFVKIQFFMAHVFGGLAFLHIDLRLDLFIWATIKLILSLIDPPFLRNKKFKISFVLFSKHSLFETSLPTL